MTPRARATARFAVLKVVWPVLKVGKTCAEWMSAPGRRSYEGVQTTRPIRHLVLAIVAGFGAAGCSSSASPKAAPTEATASASSQATSTTLDPATQAVLDAYHRYWQTYIAVGSEMKLPDPRLAEVATGEALRTLGGAFLADRTDGHVLRGTIDLAPEVMERTSGSALVRDCYASHIVVVDAASGRALGSERPDRVLVTVTLVPEAGTWKVAGIRHEGDGCAAPA